MSRHISGRKNAEMARSFASTCVDKRRPACQNWMSLTAKASPSTFSAASSQSGFSFQVLVAVRHLCEEDTKSVVFEGDEDVCAFRAGGVSWVATQTKYQATDGTVAPRSRELWKTIRIWAGLAVQQAPPSAYRLVTTHRVVDSGLTIATNDQRPMSDSAALEKRLDELAKLGSDDPLVQEGMNLWMRLAAEHRAALAASMVIIKASTSFVAIREECVAVLAATVGANDEQKPLVENLLASRSQLVLDGLGLQKPVTLFRKDLAIEWGQICYSHGTGTPTPLYGAALVSPPAAWAEAPPRFVQQLSTVEAHEHLIEDAQVHFLRAVNERHRLRRSPIGKSDIDQLDEQLFRKWRAIRQQVASQASGKTDVQLGMATFQGCANANSMIGNRQTHPHEHEGGLHHLADLSASEKRAIGWHPKFHEIP